MTSAFFIQVLINGLMLGLTYVLIASGFSLDFSLTTKLVVPPQIYIVLERLMRGGSATAYFSSGFMP